MKAYFATCLLFFAAPGLAQHPQGYGSYQAREIKALSSEDIKQYQSGAGMGFALPAELNGYPGPMHSLELAEQLKLTTEQRAAIRSLMDGHKAEARAIGARLVEAERELDTLFRSDRVTAEELRRKVSAADALRSNYRLSHLETHRRTRELLTSEQIALYDRLRGYGGVHDAHKGVR